jgi:Ca2+-dependent lipid-binding protein
VSSDPKAPPVVVYKSEVIDNTLEPVWDTFVVNVGAISGGDPTKPIKVTVFDWDSDTSSEEIGSFTVAPFFLLSVFGRRF